MKRRLSKDLERAVMRGIHATAKALEKDKNRRFRELPERLPWALYNPTIQQVLARRIMSQLRKHLSWDGD